MRLGLQNWWRAGPQTIEGSATLAGVGALTAAALLIIPATATAAGVGTLAPTALVLVQAAATPSGAGILAGDALLIIPASCAAPGTGALPCAGEVVGQGPAPPPPPPPGGGGDFWVPLNMAKLREGLVPFRAVVTGQAQLAGLSALVGQGEILPDAEALVLAAFLLSEE